MTSTTSPSDLPAAPAPAPAAAGARWSGPVLVAAGTVLLLLATVLAVLFTGAAAPQVLGDPGAVVRWSQPVVQAVQVAAATLTVGLLVLAAVALPSPGRRLAFGPALRLVSLTSGIWALATLVLAVLTLSALAGESPTNPGFGQQLGSFLWDIDLGRGLLFTTVAAALVSVFAAGATTLGSTGWLVLLSMAALIPAALSGHAAGTSSHETAVTSLGLHLLGVCVWAGGLAGLVLTRRTLGPQLSTAAHRFSGLAVWAFVLVAASGVLNGAIRVGNLSGLASRYGVLLILKTAALLALGWAGWRHRRATLPRLAAGEPGAFARLAGVEAGVMAVTIGLAVALARSAPPVSATPLGKVSLAQALTGYPLPPEPTVARWFTVWQPDLLWVVLIGLGLVLYPLGVHRLHRRGDRWPVNRTICWLIGIVILAWVTCGPPAAYGRVLFSAHMIGHMTLSMAVPMFLVLGGPITLTLRALHPRGDGTRGPREWVVAVAESAYIRLLAHPVVVSVLFAGSLMVFYYSRLFELALTTHVGHELMHAHFLFAGYLMAYVLIGIDPGPRRPTPPMKLVMLFATMTFHAFFGISLIQGTAVLARQYFGGLGRTWGSQDLLADQRFGGGLAWGIGELPTLALALIVAWQWTQSDAREARRQDRAADRDGDADLKAYNAMLARIAVVDEERERTERTSRSEPDTGAEGGESATKGA